MVLSLRCRQVLNRPAISSSLSLRNSFRKGKDFFCSKPQEATSRFFAVHSDSDDGKTSSVEKPDRLAHIRPEFKSSLTGIGQVIFLGSRTAGSIILASLAIADPFLASFAMLGGLTSTITAQSLGMDKDTTAAGLLSYNGVLVGCASSVFLDGGAMATLAATLTGSVAATLTSASLSPAMGKMPQWTFAFNFVTLSMLLRTKPFEVPAAATETNELEAASETVAVVPSVSDVVLSPFVGLSQIFVVNSFWSGLGITAAISSYSPQLAMHALVGSATGCVTGAMLSAPSADVVTGLWGFNPALTSMAIGVFFVDSRETKMLSVGGAAATAAVFGGLKEFFAVLSVPCLTLPFCITMSACYSLARGGGVPGLVLAANPHSPEKNTAK